MDNKVTLSLSTDIIGLAGYEYGEQIYETQVRNNIDISREFYIEIPPNIQFAASSFVQGFFSHIVEEIGLSFTEKRAKIISDNPNVKNKFLNKLI